MSAAYVMSCTRCGEQPAEPRVEHHMRVLCAECAQRPPLIVDPGAQDPAHEIDDGDPAYPGGFHREQRSSWAPVELGSILDGTNPDPPPALLTRTDGRALLYAGRVHAISGEPEACKGWVALAATAEVLDAGDRVLYVDFEDTAASVTSRLVALGVPVDAIRERFVYVRPDEPLEKTGRVDLGIAAAGVALAVLDGITEALTLHGLDLASNGDVAAWLDLLPRPLARAGAAVLTIDHVVKDRESRGRYAIGAQHKLAGVDCAYSMHVIEPFGRGRDGRVKITVTKDRPGHVRAFADEGRAAEVKLRSHEDGSVSVTLESPDGAAAFRPTTLMERVSRAVEDEPGIGTNALRRAVKGRAKFVQDALTALLDEGFIERRQDGDGKPVKHYSKEPFRATEDNRVPPRPDRVPETVSGTASPRPHPSRGRGHGRGAAEPAEPVPRPGNGDPVAAATTDDVDDSYYEARLDELAARHPELSS